MSVLLVLPALCLLASESPASAERIALELPANTSRWGVELAADATQLALISQVRGAGSLSVFRLDAQTGAVRELGHVELPSPAQSVALNGRLVFVGMPRGDSPGTPSKTGIEQPGAAPWSQGSAVPHAGLVQVWRVTERGLKLEQSLASQRPQRYAMFGASLAIADALLVVGAPNEDDQAGAAYVYRFDPDSARFIAGKRLDPKEGGGRFASSVALMGSQLFVGVPEAAGGGAVWRYSPAKAGFRPMTRLSNPLPGSSATFGQLLRTVGGDLLVAGDGVNLGDGWAEPGAIDMFSGSGVLPWQGRLHPASHPAGAPFGHAVGIAAFEGRVFVIEAGEIYAFTRRDGAWSEATAIERGPGTPRTIAATAEWCIWVSQDAQSGGSWHLSLTRVEP